ncbi:MAG: DsbA family protein [Pseudonocardia sp.]|nr:DsbA family protein [Pseudonocardia sp.]
MTPAPPPVAPRTIQVWSDLLCPFAYVGLIRLRRARTRLGLEVEVEHRSFPLELFNGPHPRRGTDTEAVGLGPIEPDARFRVWTAPDDVYPHTVLLAAEAVYAAAEQGRAAAEEFDLALRAAFWSHSRSIAHRQVILDVAGEAGLDATALAAALDTGRHRGDLMADFAVAQSDAVPGSPAFRLPDGGTAHNPGITVHWEGPFAAGFPVIDADDPSAYDELLKRAAG